MKSANPTYIPCPYPIGAYYWTSASENPGTTWPGTTWTQITGKFLLAAGSGYSAGATGGEAAHTLTVNEMPSHNHGLKINQDGSDTSSETIAANAYEWRDTAVVYSSANSIIKNNGGGASHNNMPPYLAAYCWHRTA